MTEIISVRNISKQYRLGQIGIKTVKNDLNSLLSKIFGYADKISEKGEENDRTSKSTEDYVWSLKNISFDLHKGEVLGVIGDNGAGKSTLLKILSKVTAPTSGSIKIKGRIASLLEVGTGFHPELTGRENIFLNGAILGMRKSEIALKFDEIVAFAGVERYIDTPVKRYSSGMYVRLAFAVAAHLDPDILILDEVLAVGDAEFQKKCIEKINNVNENGKTILFVSHNISFIRSLCSRVIYLSKGKIIFDGAVDEGLELYSKNSIKSGVVRKGNRNAECLEINYENLKGNSAINTNDTVIFKLIFNVFQDLKNVSIALGINNAEGERVTSLFSAFKGLRYDLEKGKHEIVFEVPDLKLIPANYELISYMESEGKLIEETKQLSSMIVGYNKTKLFDVIPDQGQGKYLEEFKIQVINETIKNF